MDELLELTNKRKLNNKKAIIEHCERGDIQEIIEFAMEAFILSTPKKIYKPKVSLFNFSASLTLSGGSYPCISPSCRMQRANDLALFSATYANSVTIHNPFDFIYEIAEHSPKITSDIEDYVRREALIALLILYELRALIERNIVHFSKTLYLICEGCKEQMKVEEDKIEQDLLKAAEYEVLPLIRSKVRISRKGNSIFLKGTEELIGEETHLMYKKLPNELFDSRGELIKIQNQNFSSPIVQKIVNEAVSSLFYQRFHPQKVATNTYLTNNFIEKTLLDSFDKKSDSRLVNFFAEGLPLLNKMSLEQILEVRDKHVDEFTMFQEEVLEVTTKANMFDSQEEYNEYVNRKIDTSVKNIIKIQREQRKNPIRGGVDGFIAGASATHLCMNLNSPWDILMPLIGIVSSCKDIGETLIEASEAERQLKKQPMYFYYELIKE